MQAQKIKVFLESQKINPNNIEIYKKAFTHTSFINEHNKNMNDSYERLEFLGDAILGKIVSEYIFNNYENLNPGEMSLLKSKVVSKKFLSIVGKTLKLDELALLGVGDNRQVLSDSVYEDFVESLVAAIYLDQGEKATVKFVYKQICSKIQEVDINDLKDHKTKIQEYFQAENRKSVEYELISAKRVNNEMEFIINIINNDIVLATGKGKSKKIAEQDAARKALEKLSLINITDAGEEK